MDAARIVNFSRSLLFSDIRDLISVQHSFPLNQLIEDTNVSADALNKNLRSHVIDVASLRADDFQAFFICRAKALLELIGKAMNKQIVDLDSTDVVQAFGAPLN